MSNLRLVSQTILCASVLALPLGCADDNESGVVTIHAQYGPSSDCFAAGVERLRVTVGDGDEFMAEEDCGFDIVIGGVDAGRHSLLVEGIDAEGFVVFDNQDPDNENLTIEVIGGQDREVDAILTPTPVYTFVRWTVDPMGFKQCNDPSVTTANFEVSAWDDQFDRVMVQQFACDAEADDGNGYRQLDDPERDIRGNLVEVRVQPQDASGADFGAEVSFMFEAPGAGRMRYFTVSCDNNVCTGSGAPPYDTP